MKGNRILYEAKVNSEFEDVVLGPRNIAQLQRFGRPVVDFVPTPEQYKKIRGGKGRIRITTAQAINASMLRTAIVRGRK